MESLDPHHGGAQNLYEIMKDYQTIEKIMLGKKGWSFVSYLIKDASRSHDRFQKKYKRWENEKKEEDIDWLFRDASNIAMGWDFGNACVELSFDFLSANSDLLTNNRKKHKRLFKFIPKQSSYNYRLVSALKGAEYARSILKNEKDYDKKTMKSFRSSFTLNLGKVIYKIKKDEKKRKALSEFLSELKNH